MSANVSVSLSGVPELMAAIKNALQNHKPQEVRKALRPAGQMIVAEAKRNAPVSKRPHTFTTAAGEKVTIQPGNLQRSIQILPVFRKLPYMVYVGPKVARRNAAKASVNAYYAHFVEYGTAAHNVGYKGKYVEAKGGQHPGSTMKPYMRPALDSVGNQAVQRAMEDIAKLIESKAK